MLKVSGQRRGPVCKGVLLVGLLASCGGGDLSGSSTCKDYMNASAGQQQHVASQLAGQYRKPDYATPLGFPEIAYECATRPTMTLNQFFASAG